MPPSNPTSPNSSEGVVSQLMCVISIVCVQSDSVVVEGKRKILVALQLMKKLNRLSHLHCKEQKDVTQKVCVVLKCVL